MDHEVAGDAHQVHLAPPRTAAQLPRAVSDENTNGENENDEGWNNGQLSDLADRRMITPPLQRHVMRLLGDRPLRPLLENRCSTQR